MRPRTASARLLRPAATAAVLAALALGASTAKAMVVMPGAATGACPSCQLDNPVAPLSSTTIVVSGRGYGHGMGMSQWGAYGMAKAGAGFQRILRFYYPGTTLGSAPVAAVRILLADTVPAATISSAGPFTAIDASGKRWELPAGEVVLDTTLSLPVGDAGALQTVPGPVTFKPKSLPLGLNGTLYRGSFKVSLDQAPPVVPVAPGTSAPPTTTRPAAIVPPAAAATTTAATTTAPLPATTAPAATAPAASGSLAPVVAPGTVSTAIVTPGLPATTPGPVVSTGLHIVNTIGLEAYIAGVVSREAPSSWPAAALQAQAVAARSYALAHSAAGLDFDLYADERSQVYGGIAAEQSSTTAAVKATAAQVVLYKGKVADTLFSASNGGRTVSAAEAYPDNPEPPPYLVAKDDPYDVAVSPYAQWGPVVLPADQVEAALGLPGALVDLTVTVPAVAPTTRTPAALADPAAAALLRPLAVVATTASGVVTISPNRLRSALGLRSSWVDIGVISLSRPALSLSYGSTLQLGGSVRGLVGMLLEQQTATGWQSIATPEPDETGHFALTTRALGSTVYRLTGGNVAGSPVSGALLAVPVAPRVKLAQSADGTGLAGTLRPALAGTQIEIQYDGTGTGTTWSSVGTATVAADGTFLASLPVASGSYRAVVTTVSGPTVTATPTAPVKVTIVS